MKLALLNTSIITTNGIYKLEDVTLEDAKELINKNVDNLDSAIGHESTAIVMSTVLKHVIPIHRQIFQQQVNQRALVFKLDGRLPEGKLLTPEELQEHGYKFQLLTRIE